MEEIQKMKRDGKKDKEKKRKKNWKRKEKKGRNTKILKGSRENKDEKLGRKQKD